MSQETLIDDYLAGEILRDVNEKLLIASVEQHELADIATQSQQRLSALVNGLGVVVCEISIPTGEILFLSEKAEAFLGYERAAWNRRGFWRRIIRPEDRADALACLLGAIRSRQNIDHEFRVITAEGRVVWVQNQAVVVVGNDNTASLLRCVLADISERKQAEETIAHSERRYRRLFEAAQDGILLLDVHTGKITDANPFIIQLLGRTHDELLGKELWELGLLHDKEASQAAFRQLAQEGHIRYENLPLANRLSERIDVEFVNNIYRENGQTVIQCNIRDITERVQVAGLLAAAATRNERIAETLQRSMLLAPYTDKFARVEVEMLYQAALEEANVGGDFFDAFTFDDNKLALVVGDVSGKGLIAAGRTVEVKYALRAFLHEYPGPEVALTHLNNFICETHLQDTDSKETFIILALAVLNTVTGETIFAAAGAEPSLILRTTGIVEQVVVISFPLGIQKDVTYTAKTRFLASGETVMMATDGITEARHGMNFLGIDGMAALAEKVGPTASLLKLSQAIYSGGRDFAGGALHDDVCLVLARRK